MEYDGRFQCDEAFSAKLSALSCQKPGQDDGRPLSLCSSKGVAEQLLNAMHQLLGLKPIIRFFNVYGQFCAKGDRR